MNKVVKAENEKIAAIDFATAAETAADGTKRSEIKKAEGIRQARTHKKDFDGEINDKFKKVSYANNFTGIFISQYIQ